MKNPKNSRIALILPAYNEASVLGEVIDDIKKHFANYEHQIVVVDDGSKDNTAQMAHDTGAYVIRHVLNMGAGGSTATGLSYAQQNNFDIAATLDADGQHKATDVLKGIELMQKEHADLLIGSRLINSTGMSKVKIFGNKGLSLITNVLFGIRVTDSQSGLRIFSKKALDSLKWKTAGYEFASEMLWRAKQQGLMISEYPIQAVYTDYSRAKGQNNWNAITIIKSLLKHRIVEMFE